jgi:Cdc6-like AAA superfamily ATPase
MTMVENAFKENEPNGIMITGTNGVGKSHSLVNLVRTLQYESSCKYLVTFIPDCGQWEFVHDLYNAICSSFGTSLSALKWPVSSDLSENSLNLNTFVKAIDLILQRMGRRWVLVFDQINELFS